LLSVISVASIIGTVIKQGEPYNNYVNQFGPFWADVFERLNLYTVYSAWWFLLILAFLVVSTSLCISRNAPRIVADWRAFKENLREQSLQAFSLRSQANLAGAVSTQAERMASALRQRGYRVKEQQTGLFGGALVDCFDCLGRLGRRRPHRSCANGMAKQNALHRRRLDC
jgi:cytochrome c biogenesis protein